MTARRASGTPSSVTSIQATNATEPARHAGRTRTALRNHRSCRTNLAEVVADLGIPYAYLPEPVNWFQNMPVTADGTIQRLNSSAAAGDKVVLRALQPLLAVGSACPMIGVNGDRPTDIRFTVRDA